MIQSSRDKSSVTNGHSAQNLTQGSTMQSKTSGVPEQWYSVSPDRLKADYESSNVCFSYYAIYSNNSWAICNNACQVTYKVMYHMIDEVVFLLFMNMKSILFCTESFKTTKQLSVQHGTRIWRWPIIIHNSTWWL